jgi:hypothetical protein
MSNRPEIVVREMAGETRVGVRGLEAVERDTDDLRALVEENKEALVAISEAEAVDPPKRHWLIGRAIVEQADDDAVLEDLLAVTGYEKSHELTASEKFYRTFPEGGIPEEWAWSPLREFFTRDCGVVARKAIKRAVAHDRRPRVYEVRTFDRCFQKQLFDSGSVVSELLDISPSQIGSEPTDGKLARAATTVRIMAGLDEPRVLPSQVAEMRP